MKLSFENFLSLIKLKNDKKITKTVIVVIKGIIEIGLEIPIMLMMKPKNITLITLKPTEYKIDLTLPKLCTLRTA